MTLDLKSPTAQQVLEKLVKWADVLIVNTPHPARKRLKLEYDDIVEWNPRLIYADLTGFGEKGPDADLPGFDVTSYWARSGLLSMTRGCRCAADLAGGRERRQCHRRWPLFGDRHRATYRRERTGKGAYVTTSLLAEGVWSASVSIQGALVRGEVFSASTIAKNPANAAMERLSSRRRHLVHPSSSRPDKLAPVAKAIGRTDLLTDPRFSDPAKLVENMPQLIAILDDVFGFASDGALVRSIQRRPRHPSGAVRGPQEVIDDPQLRLNEIVVPLEGAGGKSTSTISSPIQVHGVAKAPARRAPGIGEHNEEVLRQLGFDATESTACARAAPFRKRKCARP